MTDMDVVAVCIRVADLPNPDVPSAQHLCCTCHEPVWVAGSTPQWARFVCVQCAPGTLDRESLSIITPAQLEELNELGLDDIEIVRRAQQLDAWLDKQ